MYQLFADVLGDLRSVKDLVCWRLGFFGFLVCCFVDGLAASLQSKVCWRGWPAGQLDRYE